MRRYNQGWRRESERHSLAARRVKTGRKNKMFFHAPLLSQGKKDDEQKGIYMDKSGEIHVKFSKKDFVEQMRKSVWYVRKEISDINHSYAKDNARLKKEISELKSERDEEVKSKKEKIADIKRKMKDPSDASYNEFVQHHIDTMKKFRDEYPDHFEGINIGGLVK